MHRWPVLLILLLANCYSSQTVMLQRPVEFPFLYYQVERPVNHVNPAETVNRVPEPAYWDKSGKEVYWRSDSLYLFTGETTLDRSYDAIRKNQSAQAITMLKSALIDQKKSRKLTALHHNNLAMAYLTVGQTRKAKFHINQAGILSEHDHYVLRNARLVTSVMQKPVQFIKYRPPEEKANKEERKQK